MPKKEEETIMSDSPGTWKAEVSSVDDPLMGYQKKPIISRGGPKSTYRGRVIIELWDNAGSPDDADNIAMAVGAVDGNNALLLERVASALSKRLQKGNPFK
jgi:hypothetical protein